MKSQALIGTARAMVAGGKGLLAMHESNGTCNKSSTGIAQTTKMRRAHRDEPEVLMDGAHTQARCGEVAALVLRSVFEQPTQQGVSLESVIVKPNMVIASLACPKQNTAGEVAAATVPCLPRAVPAAAPGIVFMSGGWIGLSVVQGQHFAIDPASTRILGFETSHSQRRVMALWNSAARLPR